MSEKQWCPDCGIVSVNKRWCSETDTLFHWCAVCDVNLVKDIPKPVLALQAENAELLTRSEAAEKEIKTLRFDYAMLQIAHEHKTTLLASCETALAEREGQLSTLRESMRWIPVSERLPEDCCDVLVRRENDGAAWTDIASLDNGWFDDIAHWMPIPQPPEQETGK